jgi:hypothetical protein
LSLLLLSLCAVFVSSSARADSTYTTKSLAAHLVTKAELSRTTGATITEANDLDPSTDPIAVGRQFATDDGSYFTVNLFSPDDGASILGANKAHILSADFAQQVAGLAFTGITDVGDIGELLGDDYGASYTATREGEQFNVVQIVFVRDNVFGVILYGTSGDSDFKLAGSVYGMQLSKFS